MTKSSYDAKVHTQEASIMSLNPFTKMKINEILKHPIDDIYHSDYIELTKTNQANQKCLIEEI